MDASFFFGLNLTKNGENLKLAGYFIFTAGFFLMKNLEVGYMIL